MEWQQCNEQEDCNTTMIILIIKPFDKNFEKRFHENKKNSNSCISYWLHYQ